MHRSLRHTILYLAAIVAGQGLSFLLLPITTAYLAPAAYGEYAVALAVSQLVGTLCSSWLRNVSFRLFFDARKEGRSRAFYASVAAGQATVVLAVWVPAALVLGGPAAYAPTSVMLSAGALVLAGDFFALTVALLRAEQKAVHYAAAEIGAGVLRFAATVAGLALGVRSSHLLFLAAAAAMAIAGAYAWTRLRPTLSGPARLEPRTIAGLFRYAPAALPLSLSGWVERVVDRLVLDHYLAREAVGVYSANYALADRVVGGIVGAVFMMAWPDILRAWNDGGKPAARTASTRAIALFAWLTVGPAVLIAAYSAELGQLLGPAYRAGAAIMPIVAAAAWLSGFKSYLNRHLELELRFGVASAVAILGAALNLGLNLLLVPRLGGRGAALATLGNYLVTATIFWFMRDRELVRLPWRDLGVVAVLCAGALAATRLLATGVPAAAGFVALYALGAGFAVLRRFRGTPRPRLARSPWSTSA